MENGQAITLFKYVGDTPGIPSGQENIARENPNLIRILFPV